MKGLIKENRDRFKIDKFNLDEEVNRQVDLMDETGELHAFLVEERDLAKNEVDKIKAKLDDEIREEYSDRKITEKKIENMIILDPSYQEAYKKYLALRREEQLAGNDKEIALQRRAYLKILAELWIAQYYSIPEIKEEKKIFNKSNELSRKK
jgi:benzoyl-CoA reductase/2-hydroxyglutaryl-CoA dehydratase subunit BcrC/BadD/HgdB